MTPAGFARTGPGVGAALRPRAGEDIIATSAPLQPWTHGSAPQGAAAGLIRGHWIVAGLSVSAMLIMILLHAARLGVAAGGPGAVAALLWLTMTGWVAYAYRNPTSRRERIARDAAEYFGVMVAVTLFGIVASYAVAAQSVGYVDSQLAWLDSQLGFDWNGWYAFVIAHPVARVLGRIAYGNIYLSPAILLAWYALTGRKREARMFITAVWLSVVLTLVAFVLIPAQGPLAATWQGPIPYMPSSALYQAELIPQLRSHGLQQIHVEALQGVVCAPSFHAASGVLFIAAGWRAGPLRWPMLALNAMMLLATPVEGTHYLIDIIMGAVVAMVAIGMTRLLVHRLCPARGRGRGPIPEGQPLTPNR
jgi:hypothetical protein